MARHARVRVGAEPRSPRMPAARASGRKTRHAPRIVSSLTAAGLLALAGCGSQTGDFGRAKTDYLTALTWPLLSQAAIAYRGEPESWGATTDDERELRDRAWHFLMPQFSQNKFDDALAEMRVQRILPSITGTAPDIYLNMLLSDVAFRSLASRYRRLSEDIEADRALIVQFHALYARVQDADRIRERSFNFVHDLTQGEIEDARSRVYENVMLDQWVKRDLCYRIEMYRYALERLVLMGPMREAIYAEQGLLGLAPECPALFVKGGAGLRIGGKVLVRKG